MSQIAPNILNLISQYTSQEISKAEFNELQDWLNESAENQKLFSEFLLVYKKSRKISFVAQINKDKAWQNIVSKLETPLETAVKVIPLRNSWLKYAAAIVGFGILTTTYFYKDKLFVSEKQQLIAESPKNQIEIGSDKATLTLEDGSVVALQEGKSFQTKNANSNGKEIVYSSTSKQQNKTVYNFLSIPRGGQFFIKLSDGTQVWLNSESQLKFPVAFESGKARQVELVYGEAYFDVSPSTNHKGAKFQVLNKSQKIEVLGTEFNIKAYRDEDNISTTLVEGKVAVSFAKSKLQLLPNQQLNFNKNTNSSEINTVDVYNEIAWKDGVFSFRRKSLEEIMKVLSRWYDLDVQFENPNLKKIGFNGTLSKDQKIEDILKSIKSYGVISDFKINNKTVILK